MLSKSTWIILIIFLLLIAAAWIWQRNKQPAEINPTPEVGPIRLFNFGVEQVQKVQIESNLGKSTVFERTAANEWKISGSYNQAIDSAKLENTISEISNLTEISGLNTPPQLTEVSLSPPLYQVSFTLDGKVKVVLKIGNPTPVKSGVYIQVNEQIVQVVSSYTVDALIDYLENPPFAPTPTPVLTSTLTP